MEATHDVFISHAGEDKVSLAAPIYERLKKLGMLGFLDRDELKIGGNAAKEMIDAMETAPIGLFILSPEFAMKDWTMKELFCFHRRRAQAVGASGEGATTTPVLIPVFYRLTVAESRHEDLFSKYREVAGRHWFFHRALGIDAEPNIRNNMQKVSDALSKLAAYTGIENTEGASNDSASEMNAKREELVKRICDKVGWVMTTLFAVPCNVPKNSDDVTLDFEGAGSDEEGSSFEWKLLQEIIREDVWSKRRVVGVKGGAGVGKTCALRGVGRLHQVTFRFRGGVYYLSLGMDATVETLIAELLRILRACGRGKRAEDLSSEKSLRTVLEKVREAMKGKKSLILVDDLWQRHGLGPGTVDQVRQVLDWERGGVVVVTTRDTAVAAKGTVVEIAPRRVLSAEAKRILLGHAKMNVEEITEALQGVLEELLKLCGGLPLCLALVGRGLLQLFLNAKCKGLETWELYLGMMKEGEKLVYGEVDGYQNLWKTLRVALRVLEERLGPYAGSGRGLSWSEMYRSFCTMKKQSIVSFKVLARVWALKSDSEAFYVVNAFCGVGLADIVMRSEQSGVRLHDVFHEFSVAWAKKMDEVSEWHRLMLEGYIEKEEGGGSTREWWKLEDDAYIYENVCRHLEGSGNTEELIELVLNVKWTEAQLEHGGLRAWISDFVDCLKGINRSRKYERDDIAELEEGLILVRDAVVESWPFLSGNRRELGYQVCGRLWGVEKSAVRKFLRSIEVEHERPWAKAIGGWWGRPGRRGRGGEFFLHDVVWDIALHDERRLAVAGVGDDVVFIDLEGMKIVRTCVGHARNVTTVAFSADGTRAFSWSSEGMMREWLVETGEEVRCMTLENEPVNDRGTSKYYCAAICPQNNVAVTSLRGTLAKWDMNSGERMIEVMGGFERPVECLSVSRDCCHIVAGKEDGTLEVWNVAEGFRVGALLTGHESCVLCVAFCPKGRFVVSGSVDGTIRVWEIESGTQRGNPIYGHQSWVLCVCFSEDGRRIVSGGVDRTIRIWDAATGAQVGRSLLGHEFWIHCLSMTQDARFVVSGGYDRTVRVWDLAMVTQDPEEESEVTSNVNRLDASTNGRWFIAGSLDGTVRVYDGSSGKQVGHALHLNNYLCVDVSPCGRRFVSGSDDKTLCEWDIETGAQAREPMRGHTSRVNCVAYSPNGLFIVSGSNDKTIRVWDTATHAQVGDDAVIVHMSWVTCVIVSDDGGRIVCGCEDGRLYVWDVPSRKLVGAVRSEHYYSIRHLDMLERNVVRSADAGHVKTVWGLDEEKGLVRLRDANDSAQEGGVGRLTGERSGPHEVVCSGRHVQVRGSDVLLATLPVNMKEALWC